MLAALFVSASGPYVGLPDVDVWSLERDARQYPGPYRVVAHPPCERWGRYWHGGPSARVRRIKGDDAGCFASALASVRRWGGVLEHPAASSAWSAFGLLEPPRAGGWVVADWEGGWTCCVDQGHYGHRAQKATWLYACHVPFADADVGQVWPARATRRRVSFRCRASAQDSHGHMPTVVKTGAQRDTDCIPRSVARDGGPHPMKDSAGIPQEQ